jgi:GTP-binding protein EngB required for normal cell division
MSERYVVFTGRPNSGKSTTIRALTGIKVRTGKKPGTTRSIEKYPIAQNLFLVDMPGYGRKLDASKQWEDKTKDSILDFIENEMSNIVLAVHVVNITTFLETEMRLAKKGFISFDGEMIRYLHETLEEFPLVAANKIDKGSERDVAINIKALLDEITGGNPSMASGYVFPISAKKGIGIGPLKECFIKTLTSKGFSHPLKYIR